jgi:hypothetical protein
MVVAKEAWASVGREGGRAVAAGVSVADGVETSNDAADVKANPSP